LGRIRWRPNVAEHFLESNVFNAELVRTLHSKLLLLERMADEALAAAKQGGYFDDPDAAEPLRWLEGCNEQVKDCMVALESMLDPELDGLMTLALEEHQRCGATTRGRLREKLEKLKAGLTRDQRGSAAFAFFFAWKALPSSSRRLALVAIYKDGQ
jgi:hypothetical protein